MFRSPLRPSPGRLRQLLPRLNGAYCIIIPPACQWGILIFFSRPKITRKPLQNKAQINLPQSHDDGRTQARSRPRPRNRTPTAHRRKWGICGGIWDGVGRVDVSNRPSSDQPSPPRPPRLAGFRRFWAVERPTGERTASRSDDRRADAGRATGRTITASEIDGRRTQAQPYRIGRHSGHSSGVLITC